MSSGSDPRPPAARIRRALPADVPVILGLIRALAAYEVLEHELALDADGLHDALFGRRPFAEALVAEQRGGGAEVEAVGYALYFKSFSTFRCRPGVYLEDLFVLPRARRQGIGLALLRAVCAEARRRRYARVEWSVLDWNAPAIAFYERLGAVHQREWQRFRLDGEALVRVASVGESS
jgi:GNAT superfamily N-acetyltransferase